MRHRGNTMRIKAKVRELARKLWIHAVAYCEAKDEIETMRQHVNSAVEAAEIERQKAEEEISKARKQSQYDIECANREKVEADQAIAEKQHDLELLKSRIDEEAVPIAEELIAKAKKETTEAMRQTKKKKDIATAWIGKIGKRIEIYENTDFDLTFEYVQDLKKTLEYEFYNTERKLDAIHKVLGNWDIPKKLRNRVDGDRQFINSIKDEASRVGQS